MTKNNEIDQEIKVRDKVVALAGGVGGAKLALGLYRHLQTSGQASRLTIIGNTGDDLEMFGVRICPDIDTILYTLSGLANPATGWGIEGDTFKTLDMLKRFGENCWFWIGDKDFATHLLRTQWLREGYSLTEVVARLAKGLGLECELLPMADGDVRTKVQTLEAGELPFQEYFVHRQAKDTVQGLRFEGAEKSSITIAVKEAIRQAKSIVICPSNPYLSIWPILAVPGIKAELKQAQKSGVKIAVVSPIVGGIAIKGPAAAIMQTLGEEKSASALGVANLYKDLADLFVLDNVDASQEDTINSLGLQTLVTDTIMKTEADKIRLASTILETIEK